MKRLIVLSALILLFVPAVASAAGPYLVSTCQANVTKYDVDLDGSVSTVDATDGAGTTTVCTGGQMRLSFELVGITDGAHNISVTAKNIWGSTSSVPFAFDKSVPGTASNIKLSESP